MLEIPSDLDVDEYANADKPKTINQILSSQPVRRGQLKQASMLPPELQKRPSSTGNGEIDELKFKDPLSQRSKLRIRDLTRDYAVMSAMNVLIHYVLGRQFKATVYPVTREQLDTQEEVNEALNKAAREFNLPTAPAAKQRTDVLTQRTGLARPPTTTLDQQQPEDPNEGNPFKPFQEFIDVVDLNCELDIALRKALAQCYFYDRAALWIIKANADIVDDPFLAKLGFREDVPTGFRPLDSFSLGQITVNTKSWEPKMIEYRGNLGGIDDVSRSRKSVEELDAEELVYFTRNDYNIIPDSLNYGSLGMEPILELSESLRRLNKKVFPEITNNQWAGTHLIEIPGTSEKELKVMVNSIKPGRTKILNQRATVHNLNPQFDMSGTINLRSSTILNMLLKIGVPSFVMNFEDIPNVATALTVAFIWQETKLEDERNWVRTTLWRQWYRKLMDFFYPDLDKQFLYLRVKVINEFKSIEFASIFEKAIAISNLRSSQTITEREARELLNMPPFPPDRDEELELASQILAENPDLIPIVQQVAQNQKLQDQTLAQIETGGNKNEQIIKPGASGIGTAARTPEKALAQIRRKYTQAGNLAQTRGSR